MLAHVHNRRPQGAEVFRPQKSSIAVVRLRSVLPVREDGSRTGSAIFVAKKRRKQPHVNRTPRTQTRQFMRSEIAYITKYHENFLPVRPEPIKSLTRPRRGCTRTSNTKTSPTKTNELKRKHYKLPTTLNTTAKDKAQNAAQQRPNKNAARRIPTANSRRKRKRKYRTSRLKHAVRRIPHRQKAPSEARAIKHNSAVKSRGTRDGAGRSLPNGGPRKFQQS